MERAYNFNTNFTFEDLKDYDRSQNYLQLLRELSTGVKESKHPNHKITIAHELRRLRKYHSDLFSAIFSNIVPSFVSNFLEDDNYEVNYYSLLLVSEIFSEYSYNNDFVDTLEEWISQLLPAALELSVSTNIMVSTQAALTCDNLANNMFYEQTVMSLIDVMASDNGKVAHNATQTMISLITYIGAPMLLDSFDWQDIFTAIADYLNKGDDFIRMAGEVIFEIRKKLNNDYDYFLTNLTDEQQKMADDFINKFQNSKQYLNRDSFEARGRESLKI
jgi:hypothetical protein